MARLLAGGFRMATSISQTLPTARRAGFYTAVGLSLALIVFGLGEVLAFGVVGWLDAATLETIFPTGALHRVHGLGHSLVAWAMAVCVTAQLWRPTQRLAAAVVAVVTLALYTLAGVVSGVFDGLEVVGLAAMGAMVWLHPGRDGTSWTPRRLRIATASPLLVGGVALAALQLTEQTSGPSTDPHVALGHFGVMATVGLVLASAAFIGSTNLAGSGLAAWLAVAGAIYLGFSWMLFPGSSSSLGRGGGLVAVAVGLVFAIGLAVDRNAAP